MNKFVLTLLVFSSFSVQAKYSFMYETQDFDKILDLSLKDFIQTGINNKDQSIQIKFTTSKGTSAYINYDISNQQNKSNGAILAKAESNDVLGEIVSYRLANLLDVEEIYSAKTLIKIEGQGLQTYKEEMLKLEQYLSDPANGKIPGAASKKINLKNVLSFIEKDKVLWCDLAPWGHRPFNWDALIDENHPLRKSITAKGAQPETLTTDEIKNYVGTFETTLEHGIIDPKSLAIELSNHMVIDILAGQYDRFSGGNLQYLIDNSGKIHIGAYDNGGTFAWSESRYAQYFKIVSRFDKNVVLKLKQLQAFLNGETARFNNVYTENELLKLLELSNNISQGSQQLSSEKNIYINIKIALNKLIQHIEDTCKANSEANCYFN